MNWYEKYLSIYEKPFSEVPQEIIDKTHDQLAALQSDNPKVITHSFQSSSLRIMRKSVCKHVFGL